MLRGVPPVRPASDLCLQTLQPCSWYRRAGLVFWPKANRLAVTIRYDPTRQVLRLYRMLVRRQWRPSGGRQPICLSTLMLLLRVEGGNDSPVTVLTHLVPLPASALLAAP